MTCFSDYSKVKVFFVGWGVSRRECLIQWPFVMLSGVFQKAELHNHKNQLNHINPDLLTQTFLNCGYKLKNVAKSNFRQFRENAHTHKKQHLWKEIDHV